MSYSWHVRIEIGGEATHDETLRIFGKAADKGLLVSANDVHAQTLLDNSEKKLRPQDINDLTCCDATLSFTATHHHDDGFEELEEACREIGLPYLLTVSGDEDGDGFTLWWLPDMDGTERCDINIAGEPVITLSDLEEARKAGTLHDLIARSHPPRIRPFIVRD